jgi:hypothetical protein
LKKAKDANLIIEEIMSPEFPKKFYLIIIIIVVIIRIILKKDDETLTPPFIFYEFCVTVMH